MAKRKRSKKVETEDLNNPKKSIQKKDILIFGHRGNSGHYPENSVESVKSCLDGQDVYGAEIDVQMTKDGELIVFHDDDFSRFGGAKTKVMATHYNEIKDLKNMPSDSKIKSSNSIATLDDIMEVVPENDLNFQLNIELKVSSVLHGENIKTFVNRVYTQVDSWIDPTKVLFTSFEWDCLDLLRHYSQDMQLGVLTDQPDEGGWISKVKQVNAKYIIVPMNKINGEFIDLVDAELDTEIIAYTEFSVEEKEQEIELARKISEFSISGLIVNYPTEVAQELKPKPATA